MDERRRRAVSEQVQVDLSICHPLAALHLVVPGHALLSVRVALVLLLPVAGSGSAPLAALVQMSALRCRLASVDHPPGPGLSVRALHHFPVRSL